MTSADAPHPAHAVADPSRRANPGEQAPVSERSAWGKRERLEVPRSSHATWEPSPLRRSPVEVLEEQASTRVPELVPIRYGRMLASPFAFYRGSAALMAADLAAIPSTALRTQLCGDAHLSNFGVFAAPDRRLVFSINDFDETLPGPFEWDVKRLAASFAVAGRERGVSDKKRSLVNTAVGQAYREALAAFAAMRNLDLWYSRTDVEDLVAGSGQRMTAVGRKQLDRGVAKARSRDSLKALGKLTEVVDGEPRIISDPPMIVPIEELSGSYRADEIEEFLRGLIRSYKRTLPGERRKLLERYRLVHAARKVVGVGSVGMQAWIVLFLGRDGDDPLFLQAKEAEHSVLEPFLGKSEFANHAQRVVEGQRLMQAASDITLGWIRIEGVEPTERDFYVRQLWDAKGSVDAETMDLSAMLEYAKVCGAELARAHARSGDAVAISSYLGSSDSFDRALALFAEAYADQNERDYAALVAAVKTRQIKAETGV